MNSAAVPNARPHAPFHTQTRSPIRAVATPSPTLSMTPAPSLCGTMRGNASVFVRTPARDFTSDGLTPDHATLTRTSFGPGVGVGNSATVRTSPAGPVRS
jgi:hypothetical protein